MKNMLKEELFSFLCLITSHKDDIILKFWDDTAVIGCITGREEAAHRREVASLVSWCEDNNLTLNTDKTKEMIVDLRKKRRPHRPLFIQGLEVERVNSFKYLGVHISEDFTWTLNTTQLLKKSQQQLYFLRRLRKFGMWSRILCNFYSCIVESILTIHPCIFTLLPSGWRYRSVKCRTSRLKNSFFPAAIRLLHN